MRLITLLLSSLAAVAAFPQLVINEVDYDQPGTDNDEYIELKNTGAEDLSLQNIRVVLVNGATGTGVIYRTFSSAGWGTLASGAYFTLCANAAAGCDATITPATDAIQNGPADAIVLLDMSDSSVVDLLGYEGALDGFHEGTAFAYGDDNVNVGRSIGRVPDGSDTNDNNLDFILMCDTRGATNGTDTLDCTSSTGIVERSIAPELTLISDPGSDLLWVRGNDQASGSTTFEIFTVDGSRIATRTDARNVWAWPTGGRHGCVLLVRATMNTGTVTKRVVLP